MSLKYLLGHWSNNINNIVQSSVEIAIKKREILQKPGEMKRSDD